MIGALLINVGLIGACAGSFAATAGLRMANDQGWVSGRSACDGCSRQLGYRETIPVLSYMQMRGRCVVCRSAIHPAHLTGELLGLVLAPALLVTIPLTSAALLFLLAMLLVAGSASDLKAFRLPDMINLMVALCSIALATLKSPSALFEGLATAGVTVVIGLGLRLAGQALKGQPGLGLGDVKLMGALALGLGLWMPIVVAAASALALLVIIVRRGPDGRLPFGPFLAVAGFAGAVGRALV